MCLTNLRKRSVSQYLRPEDGDGFTLIELLIAVTLSAILLTALYGTFFSILRAREAVEDKLEEHIEAGRFLGRFCQEISASYFKATNPKTFFSGEKRGTASAVSFTTFSYPIIKEDFPASDLMAVNYFTEESDNGDNLYKEVWNPYAVEKSKVEVLEGINGFEVSFLNGKEWAKAWDSSLEKRLPDAVRVRVIIKGGKELSILAVPRIR